MVGFRKDYETIVEEYGSYYLIVRTNKKLRCSCVDSLYSSPKKDCPICLGTGYLHRVERIKGRSVEGNVPETLAMSLKDVTPGILSVAARTFYLHHESIPTKKDLLITCDWNGLRPVFDDYTNIYEISTAEPLKGSGGRTEFFRVSTKKDPINADAKLHNILNNAAKLTYYVTVR